MRKILAVLSIVAAATTLAGCSAGQSKVDAYRTVVHAMPDFANISDANLEKAANGVCAIFKTDETKGWDIAVSAATQNGATDKEAAVLVKAAVAAYCPQYVNDLQ